MSDLAALLPPAIKAIMTESERLDLLAFIRADRAKADKPGSR
jgi:hypothetical protein